MTPPAHQPRTGRVLPHAHSLATARMRLRAVTGQCAGAWWLAPWRSPWQPLQSLMHGKYALSIAKTPIRAVVDAVLWLWSRTRCDRRSEEHTSELQSLMRTSYAVFCLKK